MPRGPSSSGVCYSRGMRPILIGAGRGSRLAHMTAETPKTLVPVMGRPMLDWILEALGEAGFKAKDVVFVCGYQADVLRASHPEFTYVENRDWETNNILLSLLTAREHLAGGFVSSYTDIIYRGSAVRAACASPHDKVLVCDTDWRRRYVDRSKHPESDGEKMRAEGERVVELSRRIASEAASGEFIGVTKFTKDGARELVEAFDAARAAFAGKLYREGRTFERAYLIDLFQAMIETGSAFHRVDTHGGYMEIDTLEDLENAEKWWRESA
jgi:L-glutamine-phosphate cytidylyltransferase